jgi:hypothetical protein
MRRPFLAILFLIAGTAAAFASANLDCAIDGGEAKELQFEAVTSRDGKFLASFRGSVELEPGRRIEFERKDVRAFSWNKNVAIRFAKRTPQGLVDIEIRAKPVDDLDLAGTFTLRAGKLVKKGKVKCSGG